MSGPRFGLPWVGGDVARDAERARDTDGYLAPLECHAGTPQKWKRIRLVIAWTRLERVPSGRYRTVTVRGNDWRRANARTRMEVLRGCPIDG